MPNPTISKSRRCPSCSKPILISASESVCVPCLFGMVMETPIAPDATEKEAYDLVSPEALLAQRQFAGYELLEELGRGGMGVVFRARHMRLDRVVALKVIATGELSTPLARERFRREAEVAAALDHPRIVPIFEVGEHAGWPFFAMRWVPGSNLATAGAAGGLSPTRVAEIVATIGRALHHAHQRGVLHRDLKPENVLLDEEGGPHLTDFGLARRLDAESPLSRSQVVLGTPGYLSPEQASGDPGRITTATDIHGLGAVLFQLLTGRPPFVGATSIDTVRQVLEVEAPLLRTLRPEIDRDLETICQKCLQKDPRRRYPSAEAVAAELERWLRHEPIEARPAVPWDRFTKWTRRRPWVAATFGVVILALLGTIGVLTVANRRIRASQHFAETQAEESRKRLIRLNVVAGNQLLRSGEDHQALLWFVEALRLEKDDAAREDVHRRRYAAVLRRGPRLSQIWFHGGFVHGAAFSRDGSRALTHAEDNTIRVWRTDTGEAVSSPILMESLAIRVFINADGTQAVSASWSGHLQWWDVATARRIGPPRPFLPGRNSVMVDRDHRWLIARVEGGLQTFDLETGTIAGPLFADAGDVIKIFLSPHGDRAAGANSRHSMRTWEVPSGTPLGLPIQLPATPKIAAFSTDGRRLVVAYGDSDEVIGTWDVLTGEPLMTPVKPGGDLFECEFSPDGRWIVTGSWSGAARIFDSSSGLPIGSSMRHRRGVSHAIFNPTGTTLATASWDNTARLWDPLSGEPASPSLHHAGYVTTLEFGPGGETLLTSGQDQTARLWNMSNTSPARLVLRHQGLVRRARFSSDAARILTCGIDGYARVWDATSGELLLALRHPAAVIEALFHPSERHIFTACQDGNGRVWNALTGLEEVGPFAHGTNITGASFSRDGDCILTAGRDGIARVWDSATARLISATPPHGAPEIQAKFHPDGRRILTASHDGTARIWDARTGEPKGPVLAHTTKVWAAAFSPDGDRMITACSDASQLAREAHLWDVATGKPIGAPLPHNDGVLHVEFSPDGQYVATSGEDTFTKIWDARTGEALIPAMRHESYSVWASFSPNSLHLLTVSSDGSARIWDVADGEPITPPLRHERAVVFGTWSPDGRRVLTCSFDGTARVWDVSPDSSPLADLQRRAELLSAHRLDPNSGAVALTREEIRERWFAKP